MRILFVSQLFDPENSIKGLDFARRLKALGHDIEVVTTYPSYPGGKVYPGYHQKWRQVDHVDGVKIVRLPTYISHGTSAAKRLLSYASFGLVAGLYALFGTRKADVIYAYYPPVVVGALALFVGAIRRTPYVYDVQDLWPEALVATGNIQRGGKIESWINRFCNSIYHRAARVVVLSEGYRRALVSKGVPRKKVVRVFNWCDESRMRTACAGKPISMSADHFNILYAGNLGTAQALEHVIDAARLMHERGEHRVRFLFLGAGVAETELRNRAKKYGLDNVQFLPRVSVDEVGDYLTAADALLVHLADEPVFEITIPQKTQAYMLAGRPILMAVRGEAGEIIKDAGAGFVVEPCKPEPLAAAATAMSRLPADELKEMADRGSAFYKANMSMENGVRAIDDLLKSVVDQR